MSVALPHEALAEWWGSDLDDASLSRIASAPEEQWTLFADMYQRQRSVGTSPARRGRTTVYCELGSKADELYDGSVLPLGAVRVRALALLAHHVVVADPMDTLTFQILARANWDEPVSSSQRLNALRLVESLRPLAVEGTLTYVHAPNSPDPATLSALAEFMPLWRHVPDGELDWRWLSDPRGVRGDASAPLAALEILVQLGKARHSSPDGSIFIGTPLERSVLQYLYRISNSVVPNRFDEFSTYAALPIPILVPESSTVVSIRGADEYGRLRDDLARALTQVSSLSNENETWLEEARSVVYEEMAPSRRALEAAVTSDTPLARTKRSLSALSFSALGAAASSAVGGKPAPSIVAGAVSGISTLLASFLSERRGVRERKAVLESYLMFDQT